MELIITFAQELDEDLVELLGIDEDTEFEAYFSGGTLYVRPLTEDEEDELDWGCPVTDVVCDGDCENCGEDMICALCPSCGEQICFESDTDPEEIVCPACGHPLCEDTDKE